MSSEAPVGWRTMSFSEAVAINPKRSLPKDGVVPFLDMASLPLNGADVSVSAVREVGSGGSKFQTGDTLFARITPCAENGKLGFVQSVEGGEVAQGSTEFVVMAGRAGLTLPEYVRYLAGWSEVRELAIGLMEGTSGRQRVPNWAFDEIEAPIPSLDEQQQIAEVLRSVDEAAATLEASLCAALSVRQATLDDVMRSEASSTENRPLESSADIRTGLAKNAGRQGEKISLPYLRVANVQDGWIDLTEVKSVNVDPAAVSRYSLRPGDVLLTEGGDYDKLGRGGVWTGEIEPCLHQNHVFAVRPDSRKLSSAFLALLTQSYLGRAYFLSCAKRTTNLASINSSQLKKLPVPALSLSRQQEIASEIGSIDRLIAIEKERGVALRRLRKALSHDLLSGRVRLPALAPATSTARAVQPAFKRAVFAAEVVHQLHNHERFGSVKHEKIVHLCELHLRLQDDLDRHAYKEAAGPYDPSARRSVERIFRQQKWFDPTKQDKRIVYLPLEASGGHARYYDRYFGDRRAEVQTIIDLLGPLTTQQCEIIATLYAVWNDFLIDGREPSDDEIVDGVLNNWTDSKRKIPEEKWRAALPWMRGKGLIPAGHGEKTRVAST